MSRWASSAVATMSFRERQLVERFRACDERGQHVIETMAREQAAYAGQPAPLLQQRSGAVILMRRTEYATP